MRDVRGVAARLMLLDGTPVIRSEAATSVEQPSPLRPQTQRSVPSKTLQMQKPLRVPSQDPIEIAGW